MLLRSALLAACAAVLPPAHDPLPSLAIGDAMPAGDVAMKDVDGRMRTLGELKGPNGIMVIFSSTTCFFVGGMEGSEGWEGRFPALMEHGARHGMPVVLVNSNEATREEGDGYADMQARYEQKGYSGSYLLDAGHRVADAFGARTTPHVFLFDKLGRLAYKGAIDDNVHSAAEAKHHWAADAIANVAQGLPADPAITRNLGCSIKRVPHAH